MKTTILVDNVASGELGSEWGFSALIETESATILLDTGATGMFAENARKLGIDLTRVDFGVLSHAHFDHANGLETFFAINDSAPFLIQANCKENCFSDARGSLRYIGIAEGTLERFAERFQPVKTNFEFAPGVWIIPHATSCLDDAGEVVHMYVKVYGELIPDNFSHEQSLVIETESGLVVYNSCSHSGIDAIISDVSAAFPERNIHTFVGGLHLYQLPDNDVLTLANKIKACGIDRIYTGHCTGGHAIELLKQVLGKRIVAFSSGLVFEV